MSKELAMDKYLEANAEGKTALEIRAQINKLIRRQKEQETVISELMEEVKKLKENR